jgi:hypothetical protein
MADLWAVIGTSYPHNKKQERYLLDCDVRMAVYQLQNLLSTGKDKEETNVN